eukprot:TRINITY_DN4767_c0_g1_i1.p1 TRINITY_DN4767_c0_g1~~TRINITY_DN4767_c0_g1_i1.p1  ORF type:complete len:564 (+),score=150.33 TRINITY_DN4767_c0_g1_i1:121-1812(+)
MGFRQNTAELYNLTGPFQRFFDIQVLSPELYSTSPGGVYVKSSSFTGSVGVACNVPPQGSAEQEKAIAEFAGKAIVGQVSTASVLARFDLFPEVGSVISWIDSRALTDAALTLAGKPVAVAVVDSSANLKALKVSSDSLPEVFVKAAISKAIAARSFNLDDSSGLNNASEPKAPAYGVQITNGGLFTVSGGAVVYSSDDSRGDSTQIIGAVAIEGPDYSEAELSTLLSQVLVRFSLDLKSQNDAKVTLRHRRGVTAFEANAAIAKAIEIRKSLTTANSPGVYVVTDVAGHVRAHYVEDGCEYGAPDIAVKSSLASALFQLDSYVIGQMTQPGQPLYNVELLFGGLVTFESASVLYAADGSVIGAIGVSGTGAGKGTANDGIIARQVSAFVRGLNDKCALSASSCYRIVESVIPVDLSVEDPFDGVSLAQAVGLIDAVQNFSLVNSQSACITVLTSAGRPKARFCQDDAFVGATDLSPRKALSGQAFGKANQELQQAQLPGGILYKVEVTNGGLFFNAGGAPLKNSASRTVGGVGVAGASNDADAVAPAVSLWQSIQSPSLLSN